MRHVARRFALAGGGVVSGSMAVPPPPARQTVVVLAPGAGTDMTNPLLVAVADGLAARGYPTLRFNFPYKERGGRAPDPAPVLEACYRAVLEQVRGEAARVVIGGKSMGGRMASHLAAQGVGVDGLLFLGYPLHPAGKPAQLRDAHLARIAAPMLFLTGTRDALCRLDLLRPVLERLPRATLHVVDDADHSFAVRQRSGRAAAAVLDELLTASTDWLHGVVEA